MVVLYVVSYVEMSLLEQIKEVTSKNATYGKLVQQVSNGIVKRYWVEDRLFRFKEELLYVFLVDGLKRVLLKETHDPVMGEASKG